MASNLNLPELKERYLEYIRISEEHGFPFNRNEDSIGVFLWFHIPKELLSGDMEEKHYWDLHEQEIMDDLYLMIKERKIKKIMENIKKKFI
jgi:hypothetical protein